MKINRDQVTGALIVLLGILVFISISSYKVKFSASYPGPQALPGLAAIGFIICGAGIFLEGTKKGKMEAFLNKEGFIRLVVSIVMLAAYVALMKFVGFIVPTFVYLYACSTYYAKGFKTTLLQRLIFAAAVTAVCFLAYQVMFGYILPTGELFG